MENTSRTDCCYFDSNRGDYSTRTIPELPVRFREKRTGVRDDSIYSLLNGGDDFWESIEQKLASIY